MIVLDLVWENHPTGPCMVTAIVDPPAEPRTYTWRFARPSPEYARGNSILLSRRPLPEPLQSFVLAAHEQAIKESHS